MATRLPPEPDQYLVGNGRWCSTCCPEGRPSQVGLSPEKKFRFGCNECAGKGRVAFSAEQIVADTVSANRAWRARR